MHAVYMARYRDMYVSAVTSQTRYYRIIASRVTASTSRISVETSLSCHACRQLPQPLIISWVRWLAPHLSVVPVSLHSILR
jgi:hypothetical protein